MTPYEYKVVPAPRRARRYKGVRGKPECFARTLEETIAAEAHDGWEFQRADSLACEERKGWFGGHTETLHTVLVFRRALPQVAARPHAEPRPASAAVGRAGDPGRREALILTRDAAPDAAPDAPAPRGGRIGPADR